MGNFMKLKRTGIPGLDEFLRGGLPPSVVLLLGSPDKGHEIFARQIALFRSKEIGVTYFTVSKTQEAIRTNMSAYNMDVTSQEKAGRWKFINLDKNSGSIKTAIITEMKQNRCVVLDSLSELLLYHNIKKITDLVIAMSNQNNETKELHFILLTKGMQDSKIEITIQHFADGVINFEALWNAEVLARNFMIQKMSGPTVPIQRFPYSIDERGFTIETSTRIT
jgi:KaiC/GvpD/RAD55 family RecA-like ATPase